MTLAIVCPGQGAQHAAMFDPISKYPEAQQTLAAIRAAETFDAETVVHGSVDIFSNALAQPLLCAYQTAAWAALAPLLPMPPMLFLGYSVGELAAYGCAGALAPAATVRLARQRAALMASACARPSALVAVRGLARAALDDICAASGTEVAIVNGDDHFIVGGTVPALSQLQSQTRANGAMVQPLKVAVAAHTSLLAPATPRFRAALEASSLADPTVPVLAGISAAPARTRADAIDALARQVSTAIDWSACLDAAHEHGCRVFLELGPGNALARLVRERFPDVASRSVSEFRSLEGAADWVARNR